MEKAEANKKLRSKILKLLPKAVTFRNLPFSPRHDNRTDVNAQRSRAGHQNKAFSGPMIPAEARRKSKNFEAQEEPSSPKVSCMGQVKHKSKISQKKQVSLPEEFKPVSEKIERRRKKKNKKPDRAEPAGESAPALGQMRRFASSREKFANFDWTTAQIAPEVDSDSDDGDDGGGGIPFAVVGGGGLNLEPRKEINLWKRRSMATRPQSLQLN